MTETYLYYFSFRNHEFGEVQECTLTVADQTKTALVVVRNHITQNGVEGEEPQVLLYWAKRVDPNDAAAMENPDNKTVIPAYLVADREDVLVLLLRYTDEEGNLLSTQENYAMVAPRAIVYLNIHYLQTFPEN